ncbi:MAG: TPM domain-containing protein [Bacteroidetes bacterium]|nr:TPM domain-containing protein [Bacteroidota bacterium]
MKRLLILGLVLLTKLASSQNIPARPTPPRAVNDLANVLGGRAGDLEQKLRAYNDSTSSQIAIVTVPSLGDNILEDYTLKILRDWGIGQKGKNNGILIFAAMKEHKLRIEVGDGLEGAVPDITARQIIDRDLKPNFKAGNYYEGFDKAIDDVVKAAAGEYKNENQTVQEPYYPQRRSTQDNGSRGRGGNGFGFIIFIAIIIIIAIIRGGRGGGGGGGMYNRGGFLPWFLLGSMLGNRNSGGGGWSGGDRGGGGWSGGGDSGGGGFDFGGGSGSGGGASGDW